MLEKNSHLNLESLANAFYSQNLQEALEKSKNERLGKFLVNEENFQKVLFLDSRLNLVSKKTIEEAKEKIKGEVGGRFQCVFEETKMGFRKNEGHWKSGGLEEFLRKV